jgi:SAM-dependent methyltransferase
LLEPVRFLSSCQTARADLRLFAARLVSEDVRFVDNGGRGGLVFRGWSLSEAEKQLMQTATSIRATAAWWSILAIGILSASTASAVGASPEEQAKQIAALAGFHGGLIVHVGCGDGQLTAALRQADNCVVQGLESDAKQVETARAAIRARGMYGPVSVLHWDARYLPYVDNLAAMVVCEDVDAVPLEELMRVVRPHGAAVVKRDGTWTVTVKPPLPGTDQWQQHFRGADNNAVAEDTVIVGPPRRYQWLGEPQWQRSHLAMPSINSMVSTEGGCSPSRTWVRRSTPHCRASRRSSPATPTTG